MCAFPNSRLHLLDNQNLARLDDRDNYTLQTTVVTGESLLHTAHSEFSCPFDDLVMQRAGTIEAEGERQHSCPILQILREEPYQNHHRLRRRWLSCGRIRQNTLVKLICISAYTFTIAEVRLLRMPRVATCMRPPRIQPHLRCLCVQVGQTIRIGGWVKTGRGAGGGEWVFLEVNDGTCFDSMQVNLLKHCLLLAPCPHCAVQ